MKILALISVDENGKIVTEAIGTRGKQEAAYKHLQSVLQDSKKTGVTLEEYAEVPPYVHVDDIVDNLTKDTTDEVVDDYGDTLERLGE